MVLAAEKGGQRCSRGPLYVGALCWFLAAILQGQFGRPLIAPTSSFSTQRVQFDDPISLAVGFSIVRRPQSNLSR